MNKKTVQKDKISSNMEFCYFKKVMEKYSTPTDILDKNEINNFIKREVYNDFNINISDIDRRKIYNFAYTMKELGYDISTYKENGEGYYLKSREFELQELKILVESILANKFITKKQTDDIINKLCRLSTYYDENRLRRQCYLDKRSKSQNDEVIDNIYKINQAIEEEHKITFEYYTYTWDKRFVPRKDKKNNHIKYTANPIGVIIKNGRYYLILGVYKYGSLSIKNYRVDRMKNVVILDDEVDDLYDSIKYKQHLELNEKNKEVFDLALYDKRHFKMYNGGEYDKVIIRIKESLINLLIDEIGLDYIDIKKLDVYDENRIYEVTFEANISKGLKKWILSLGDEVRVMYPYNLRDDIIKESKSVIRLYNQKSYIP